MRPDNSEKAVVPQGQHEQKGLVTDVIVPIAEAAATGIGIGVGSKLGQGKNPPPPPSDKNG